MTIKQFKKINIQAKKELDNSIERYNARWIVKNN